MRSLLLHRAIRPASNRARSLSWLSCWQAFGSSTGFACQHDFSHDVNRQRVLIPVGPAGFVVQPSAPIQRTGSPTSLLTIDHSEVWQAFNKAPDDNPPDQPKTTLDRQDVPATKPGMDAPESPDATNPEIDRSDYSAPGTNPDVAENDGNEYKPDQDSVDDLKKRGRTGKGKLPGSVGSNADDGNVGKDDSAGAVHPNLPGKSSADTTDKSDAPKGYDPNPNLMMDKNLANKPNDKQDRDSKKDGEVVDQDNTISSSSKQPRKAPEDVAPETAGRASVV
ncbi:hypothetical protein WJX79_000208 [Trebouxia sp. C0005]